MGTNRDSDGPPDGGGRPERPFDPPDLPELPPGVDIPDDPAELAVEAEQVRAELYGGAGPRARCPAPPAGAPRARLPVVIMCVAVVITLVSLVAMAWSRPVPPSGGTVPSALPAVSLRDSAGAPATLSGLVPAVIILVERCRCDDLVAGTAAEVPDGVTVAVVGPSAPALPSHLRADGDVRSLADPDGALRRALELGAPPADAATVVLLDRAGVVQVTPAASSVDPYRDALPQLG